MEGRALPERERGGRTRLGRKGATGGGRVNPDVIMPSTQDGWGKPDVATPSTGGVRGKPRHGQALRNASFSQPRAGGQAHQTEGPSHV